MAVCELWQAAYGKVNSSSQDWTLLLFD